MAGFKKTRERAKPDLEHGKLPAQAVELEEAVLGALLLEAPALRIIRNIINPKVFYKEAHQLIFQSILDLDLRTEPIDILTVSNDLKNKGKLDLVGGPYYITQLTNRVASAANIEAHAMIIFQKFTKREHVRLGSEMVVQGYDETIDPMDTNQEVSKMAHELLSSINTSNEKTNLELIKEATENIQLAKNAKGITGKESGFHELDNLTCGWQDGDLIIVGARPGMGKTAFSLSMAKNMAVNHGQEGAVFSLEMTALQLTNRLISNETEIPLKKIQTGDFTAEEWIHYHKSVKPLINEKLTIVDRIKNVHKIKSKMLDLHAKGKLKWAVIDYLQIATYPEFKKNREREVSEMSAMFKDLALDLNIPIILLSQLSREVEKRSTKRPQLSDLRDSGSIEQDADIIMFLFRPSYYKMSGAAHNQALGIIAKHRNGDLGTINFKFDGPTVSYRNWENDTFVTKDKKGSEKETKDAPF